MSGTRALRRPPVRGYRGGRRGTARRPSLVRDFTMIIVAWAVTAYPIIWLAYHVAGPVLVDLVGDLK